MKQQHFYIETKQTERALKDYNLCTIFDQSTVLKTEFPDYINLKENIPKSFFLFVFVIIYLFLIAASTLFPKVMKQLSTSLPVLRLWSLFPAFIFKMSYYLRKSN